MDFVMGLLLFASKKNAICVIVDRLTKSAHVLPFRDTQLVEKLAQLYVKEIFQFHGIPTDIVSDRDQRFQAHFFWQALQKAFGTKLNSSSSYHLETNVQTERKKQILEDVLRAPIWEFQGKWEDDLLLMEFSYNNTYQSTIKMSRLRLYMEENVEPSCAGVTQIKH